MTPDFINRPNLAELPAPPPGRIGWPWTESSPVIPLSGGPWPRISIITPSYNQGKYLEETIRSVLLQGYPNIEYFIIDGGSTDESVNIIRKYEPWLTGWVSEIDAGQSDAINKGFALCTGTFLNWLCSDDFLTAGALGIVAKEFRMDDNCDVLAGACFCQYDDKTAISSARSAKVVGWEKTPYHAAIWQPSCFFRRSLIKRSDLVIHDLHYCMDRELWCYLFKKKANWKWIDNVLSHYRFTGNNKSVTGRQVIIDEITRIYFTYVRKPVLLPSLLRKLWLPLVLADINRSSGLARTALQVLARGVAMMLLLLYPREHVRALQREFYQYSL